MTEVGVNPIFGTFLHAIGAISAALCYTCRVQVLSPHKHV